MRTLVALRVLAAVLTIASICPPALALDSAQQQAGRAAYDAYFGLYIGGKKVGSLHSYLKATPRIELGFALDATVGSMGQQANITMQETRFFSTANGQLDSLHFEQRAPTGSVIVNGRRRGRLFAMTIRLGGAERRHEAPLEETLQDNLVPWLMAGGGTRPPEPVGSTRLVHHLDPTSGQSLQAQVRVEKIEPRMVGGLPSQLTTVTTDYSDLSVREQSVYDGQAQLLRTQVGGFFEARREEESVAKANVAPGDLLLDAVVKTPQPLGDVERARALELALTGLNDIGLPASPRQQVFRTPTDVRLRLARDAAVPPALKLSAAKKRHATEPNEVSHARQPSDFIQSDAPALQAFARTCTVGKTTAASAIEALVGCVRGRLHSEYVPAFSNALEAFHSGRGDCTEHSVLFVALARAIGLPSRVAVGFAYWPPGNGFGWHAWAEVYVDGRWVSVDPTWAQAVADVSHVKVADGDPLSQMRVVMVLGQVQIQRAQLLP